MAKQKTKTAGNIIKTLVKISYSIFTIILVCSVFYQNVILTGVVKNIQAQNESTLNQILELRTFQANFENRVFNSQKTASEVVNPPAPDKTDRRLGDLNSRFTLLVYADFACPFCQQFHPVEKAFYEQNKAEVSLVLRHYPLEEIHPAALQKSQVVECAYRIGSNDAFWKAADMMFSTTDLEKNPNRQIADILDLDSDKFETCIANSESLKTVKAQQKTGLESKLPGTPSIFLYDSKTKKMEFIENISTLSQLQAKFNEFKN
jgi:protein-disulfide isomerase